MKLNIQTHITLFLAAGLLFTGCKTANIKSENANSYAVETWVVSGKVETNIIHCQGMAPTEEQEREMGKKIPYPDYKIYVRKGNLNNMAQPIVDSVITNSDGTFKLTLQPGTYTLLSVHQKDRTVFNKYQDGEFLIVDEVCLKKWWKNGINKFLLVNTPIEDVYIYSHKICYHPIGIPCLQSLVDPPP